MRKDRDQALIGWDSARVIRQAAKEILAAGEETARKREQDKRRLEENQEVAVMTFEQPDGTFRMETLSPVVAGVVAKVYEKNERFLIAEMRCKLSDILLQYGVYNTNAESRKAAATISIRNMGKLVEK